MYESFFHFRQRPFLVAPCTERYFPGQAIEHARTTLIRCVERAQGPALLMGPVGTGKSLVCQLLAEHFRPTFTVAQLANTKLCTRRALLQSILFELNLPYRDLDEGELRLSLVDFLEPSSSQPNGLLLIIDEAHTLPLRLIEEVRMITNLVREGQPRVRLVLVGGPQLEEKFANPKLESFNQRIAARCYLQSLNREETYKYVRSQIASVGAEPSRVFSQGALNAIFIATDGIPRLINQLCDYALLLSSVAGKATVENSAIEEAWADLQQLPAPWQTNTDKLPLATPSNIIEFGALDDSESGKTIPPMPTSPQIYAAHESHRYSPLEQSLTTDAQLDQIESQVAEFCADEYASSQLDDFGFARTSVATPVEEPIAFEVQEVLELNDPPEPAVPTNPFGDFFEEEVVIDGAAGTGKDLLQDRPQVSCLEGREFAASVSAIKNSFAEAERQKSAGSISFVADEFVHELPVESQNGIPFTNSQVVESLEIMTSHESRFDPASDPVLPEPLAESDLMTELPIAIVSEPIVAESPFAQSIVEVASIGEFSWPAADAPSVTASRMRIVPRDDRDLIVIDDEPAAPDNAPPVANTAAGNARRQEYRQLFAKLRRN